MKSWPHLRLLTALACLLLGTGAFALASQSTWWHARADARAGANPQRATAAASGVRASLPWVAGKVVSVRQLRSERRARFEQAPACSRRMLLPQFVAFDDAPDDDVTEAAAPQQLYHPELALPALDDAIRWPRPLQLHQLDRPPRA